MNTEFIKKNYHISTFILLYFSLILGFFLGENTTLGPKFDFNHALKQVELFERDFLYTFFSYPYKKWGVNYLFDKYLYLKVFYYRGCFNFEYF